MITHFHFFSLSSCFITLNVIYVYVAKILDTLYFVYYSVIEMYVCTVISWTCAGTNQYCLYIDGNPVFLNSFVMYFM